MTLAGKTQGNVPRNLVESGVASLLVPSVTLYG
jgi:hypothetical protein